MPRIARRISVPLALAAAVAAALLAPAVIPRVSAQPPEEADATLVLQRGRGALRLAFPESQRGASLPADLAHLVREVDQTLRDDLEASGIFQLQGPTELSVLTLTGRPEQDFEQYRSLGNEVVLFNEIKYEGGRMVLEGRLYDLPSRQSIAGKRYRGTPEQARRIAHTWADEIYRLFTGRPGIALTSIAFHSDRGGHTELYLMDYDGRNQRAITGHRSTTGFADWAPRGEAIAYMSYFNGPPGVYYVDLASGDKRPVYNRGNLNVSPSFSPDGSQIAFAHTSETNVDVYVCARECRDPRRITNSGGIDTNPVWSPAGDKIAFTSDRSGRPNVYVMNVDGSGVRRVSFEGDYNDGATWRPDGNLLAYASRRNNKFDVVVTNLVDLATRRLTDGSASHENPSFSPDGQRIAFALQRGRESQIYVMDVDGGNWRQLTHEGNNFAPDWSPYPQR